MKISSSIYYFFFLCVFLCSKNVLHYLKLIKKNQDVLGLIWLCLHRVCLKSTILKQEKKTLFSLFQQKREPQTKMVSFSFSRNQCKKNSGWTVVNSVLILYFIVIYVNNGDELINILTCIIIFYNILKRKTFAFFQLL